MRKLGQTQPKSKRCQHLVTLTFLPLSQVTVTSTRAIQGCPTVPGTHACPLPLHGSVPSHQPHPRHSLSPQLHLLTLFAHPLLYPHYTCSLGPSKSLYNPGLSILSGFQLSSPKYFICQLCQPICTFYSKL